MANDTSAPAKTADTKVDENRDKHKKRLFVCCDGTKENAAGEKPTYTTNVARLAACVGRLEINGFQSEQGERDHVPQLVWYSGGVGTHTHLPMELDSILPGLTGAGIDSIILDAYYFLSSNFNFGWHEDEIILVGYSRGAFAVRCLAEFISEVGLLRRVALPFLGKLFGAWKTGKEDTLKELKMKLAPISSYREAKAAKDAEPEAYNKARTARDESRGAAQKAYKEAKTAREAEAIRDLAEEEYKKAKAERSKARRDNAPDARAEVAYKNAKIDRDKERKAAEKATADRDDPEKDYEEAKAARDDADNAIDLLIEVKIKVLAEFDPVSATIDDWETLKSDAKKGLMKPVTYFEEILKKVLSRIRIIPNQDEDVSASTIQDYLNALGTTMKEELNEYQGITHVKRDRKVPSKVQNAFLAMALNEKRKAFHPMLWKITATDPEEGLKVKQCAFLGCHSDIGGGNEDPGLSQLTLLWMMAQIKEATVDKTGSFGVHFDMDKLLQFSSPAAMAYDGQREGDPVTVPVVKGEITKSHKKGIWNGLPKGDRDLPPKNNSPNTIPLRIHFSVDMLHKRKTGKDYMYESGPLKGYKYCPSNASNNLVSYNRVSNSSLSKKIINKKSLSEKRWKKGTNDLYFDQEVPTESEIVLLHEWVKQAELWWARSELKAAETGGDTNTDVMNDEKQEIDSWLLFFQRLSLSPDFHSTKGETLVSHLNSMKWLEDVSPGPEEKKRLGPKTSSPSRAPAPPERSRRG